MFWLPALNAQPFMDIPLPDNPGKPPAAAPKFMPAPPAAPLPAPVPPLPGPVPAPVPGKPAVTPTVTAWQAQPPSQVRPASMQVVPVKPLVKEEEEEPLVRAILPGPQTLFMRESEGQFFERVRKQMKKQGNEFFLPEETPVSTVVLKYNAYPRLDPLTNEPYVRHEEHVEPSYVCHRRLYFEQPNFERIGYDYGIVQPGINLGVFYYDLIMFPYHYWSDLCDRMECSAGKCLPGDPAPLTVNCERFSVTGAIGEAAAIIGLLYIVPFPWVD